MILLNILLIIGVLIIMIVGLIGVFVPVIPGVGLIFASLLAYGFLTGFKEITFNIILVSLLLTAVSMAVDYVAASVGVKKLGGTKWGVLGAMIGTLIGLFSGGPVGLLVGSFLGAVIFEYLFGKKGDLALKSGLGAFVGFLGGSLIKLVIGMAIIVVFIWRVVF